MRRSILALAAVVALGLTGCSASSNHRAAAQPAPPQYTPDTVQRAFARAGVRLIRNPEADAFVQTASDPFYAAFLTDATGDVQVNVSPPAVGTDYVVNVTNGGEQPAHKALGNVWVDYRKHSLQAPRVLRALALLREAHPRD